MVSIKKALDGIWKVEANWPGLWKSLAIGSAGAFAVWQYSSLLSGTATTHTMDYIKRYEDGRVADARQDISNTLRTYADQFNRLQLSNEQQHAAVLNPILDLEPKLHADIDTVVDFFEGLRTCVRERVCSSEVALGYFGGAESRLFWRNFEPYINTRRENNPDYAKGLEWFVTQAPSPPSRPTSNPVD
ncbi:hypothetical protein [Phenylobacterium sp.]|uniref:DUF4760 domain-containing protein n=1 Tax=Phenylobacterium sp. TaxID=1871053 RepID=UPI00286B4366|nr:hypothetical protein [Phenylobacterium sp.]